MAAVTVLGLGAMGGRMAQGLLEAGHRLTVWNRSAPKAEALCKQGAVYAATPAEAVAESELVISMLRDDQASRAVWLDPRHGALSTLPTTAVAVECSTLTVAWVRELAGTAGSRGLRLIDAPLAGSRPQAENRQLLFFAGGKADSVAAATPILQALGQVLPMGAVGCGAAFKLAVNALLGAQIAQFGELLAVLEANGVDRARAVEVLGQTPVCSPALRAAAASMLAGIPSGHFPASFPVELVVKDLGYVADAAQGLRPIPISAAAQQVFRQALAAGMGESNLTGVVGLYLPPSTEGGLS